MRPPAIACVLLIVSLCVGSVHAEPRGPVPVRWTHLLARTPDLTQTDPRAKFPAGGHAYCGPVAVANAFVRLAREGFPRLAPVAPDPVLAHIDVVRILARDTHMATCCETGTSTVHLLEGAQRYVRERGYEIDAIEYRGWRPRPRGVHADCTVADLPWIKQRIAVPATAAWINVGWYTQHPKKPGVLTRTGGHWVTLAGYGLDEKGQPRADSLILRDPSPRAGSRARFEFVRVLPLDFGRLDGPQRGLPRPAKRMLRALGLATPDGTDVALIDGVAVLRMRDPKRATSAPQREADVVSSR